MNETPQMQADAMLTEDREARAALRAAHDVETAARAALAAIDRDAKERARPVVAPIKRATPS